jgi:hypothetical protein
MGDGLAVRELGADAWWGLCVTRLSLGCVRLEQMFGGWTVRGAVGDEGGRVRVGARARVGAGGRGGATCVLWDTFCAVHRGSVLDVTAGCEARRGWFEVH